uniref:KxDL domain-containing protein n=1 Tax=Globodera pallida TaxID=36090 RepID=A0A183BPW6_GLOPA
MALSVGVMEISKYSELEQKRLERARRDFAVGGEKICQAKSDLDSISRRIGAFKQTLASSYPTEFSTAQSHSDSLRQQNSSGVSDNK